MPANLENSAVAPGLEKVSFHSSDKEWQCQRLSAYQTIALFSHACKVMLKVSKPGFNRELPDVQDGVRKAEEPEIKLPTPTGS